MQKHTHIICHEYKKTCRILDYIITLTWFRFLTLLTLVTPPPLLQQTTSEQ